MKDPRLILAAFAIALLIFVVTVKPEEVDVYDCTYEPELFPEQVMPEEQPVEERELVEGWIRQAILIEGLEWDEEQVEAMLEIAWKESRFNQLDQNPTSTAYGAWQFLDATWQYYGIEKTDDGLLQTIAAVRYIEDRYGSSIEAWQFHELNGWY